MKSGNTSISAQQLGNNNFYPSLKVYKTITIDQPDGIRSANNNQSIRIIVNGERMTIQGLVNGENFSVYNSAGVLVYHGSQETMNLCKGVFIIQAHGKRHKIIIN